ncbi:hypothetical protein ACR78N_26190, partial [Sphingobacterium siyangense]|uniref:hypothetical protein n=2 Tax=Sphingobacterium siyangense TaxID=459529 RepID=UPI003DA4A29B
LVPIMLHSLLPKTLHRYCHFCCTLNCQKLCILIYRLQLGYTNEEFGIYDKGQCIIFDDFTMDIKFVNFLFKVKSSAIKILTAKPNVNLKFIFEYLSFLNLSSNEHKRHYISEIEPMEMQLPNYIQQTYVADFLSSIDDKIKTEFEIHTLLLKQKQYLLANLFI